MKPSTSEEPDENGIDVSSNEQNHENVNCFRPLSSRSSGELNGELEEAMTPALKDHLLKQFAKKYGSEHRVRSAAFPRSSSRAEIAIKSAKVLLHDNILLDGELDTVKLTRAILTHRLFLSNC